MKCPYCNKKQEGKTTLSDYLEFVDWFFIILIIIGGIISGFAIGYNWPNLF